MNNIFKKVVIIFAAIIMTCPIVKAEEATDSAINETIVVDEIVIVDEVALPQDNSEVQATENSEFSKINLNFSFEHNKANFVKALDIFLIGFSIVFIVMILFMFVGQGIDKMFPYKKEED